MADQQEQTLTRVGPIIGEIRDIAAAWQSGDEVSRTVARSSGTCLNTLCDQIAAVLVPPPPSEVERVIAEMTEALGSGAFFNPEMFGSMLRDGDNPILRWRNALLRALSAGRQEE